MPTTLPADYYVGRLRITETSHGAYPPFRLKCEAWIEAYTAVPNATFVDDPESGFTAFKSVSPISSNEREFWSSPYPIMATVDAVEVSGSTESCQMRWELTVWAGQDTPLERLYITVEFHANTATNPVEISTAELYPPPPTQLPITLHFYPPSNEAWYRFFPPSQLSRWAPSELPSLTMEQPVQTKWFKLLDGYGWVDDAGGDYRSMVLRHSDAGISIIDERRSPRSPYEVDILTCHPQGTVPYAVCFSGEMPYVSGWQFTHTYPWRVCVDSPSGSTFTYGTIFLRLLPREGGEEPGIALSLQDEYEVAAIPSPPRAPLGEYVLMTKVLPLAEVQRWWQLNNRKIRKGITTHVIDKVDEADWANYDIVPLIHVPGDTTDIKKFQVLRPHKSFKVQGDGSTCRLAWLFRRPYVRTPHLEGVKGWRLLKVEGKGVALLTREPSRIYLYDEQSGTFKLHIDLTESIPPPAWASGFAWFNKQWYIAIAPETSLIAGRILVWDEDASDKPFFLRFPVAATGQLPVWDICTDGNYLYIALAGDIWRITSDYSLQCIASDLCTQGVRLRNYGGAMGFTGTTTQGNAVTSSFYRFTSNTAPTKSCDTAGILYDCLLDDNAYYLAGQYDSVGLIIEGKGKDEPTTVHVWTPLRAITLYRNYVLAGGEDGVLYRRTADGWVTLDTLPDTQRINDMLADGDRLFVACEGSAGVWEIKRTEVIGELGRFVGAVAFELLEVT